PNSLDVGTDAVLLIDLDGSSGTALDGLALHGGGSTVRGLVINGFQRDAIFVSSDGNKVQGNYLGTDPTGTLARPNQEGVLGAGDNNLIGGTTLADRNVISGNTKKGIRIDVSNGFSIQGNYVGVTAQGNAALGNGEAGVQIELGAAAADIRTNVISGNA